MGLFRRLFGPKKPLQTGSDKDRKRWSFARSSNPTSSSSLAGPCDDTLDANKHAIAVAAATAAVAEAALAAAHAAAEVVRLTSAGGGGGVGAGGINRRLAQVIASVRIQSAFRGYLARRALRALKALVKLQALVRGHIVRKQTADMLKRMQTLVKLQARARASRAHVTKPLDSVSKMSGYSRKAVRASSVKDECQVRAHYSTKSDGHSILKRCGSNSNLRGSVDLEKARMGSNWLDRWMEDSLWNNHRDAPLRHRHADDERSDKILEVDTWKPCLNSQQSNRNFRASHLGSALDYNQSFMANDSPKKLSGKASNPMPNLSSAEVLSLSSLKYSGGKDEAALRTADNSPQVLSTSSRPGSSARRSPFTPTRSECSWGGYLSGYSGHPNYMANTESSRAKYRSQSAPRQRLEFDKYGSTRTFQGWWDSVTNPESEFAQHVDLSYRAHPISGRLNRVGSANQRE